MKKILMPLPSNDFDPTESAVPWKILRAANHEITFATPKGVMATCDPRMLNGTDLGVLKKTLAADANARNAYLEMQDSDPFRNPLRWSDIDPAKFDALVLPGGHAPGMREYLESSILQKYVTHFFEKNKPVGAICHGVVLAARSRTVDGKHSVLFGRKTTALLATQEMLAWIMTCAWLGKYYRTYTQTVEAEVKSALQSPKYFSQGPLPLFRDDVTHLKRGFVVQDGNYLSARWPGDAHLFAVRFSEMLK
jgi:protease I